MPFTTNDLATIDAAIAKGPSRVRFSDGREVQYRTTQELEQARILIVNELAAQNTDGPLRMVHVFTDSGF